MAMIRSLVLFGVLGIAGKGCHMFEDPDYLDPCPLGEGYPCSCDIDEGAFCDDNNRCYSMNDDYRGFCTERCRTWDDCQDIQGYGIEGVCGLSIDALERPDHCLVVCNDGIYKGDCPPGQTCEWQESLNYSVCLPRTGD